MPESRHFEINTPQVGYWKVCSALLNLKRGDILLCRRGDEFAVVEHVPDDSAYAHVYGSVRILMQGNDARQLADEFKADAKLTLEFMGSNLTAKAQKIVWEQFPDHRPGHVVAAISERCHQAIANEETISQSQKVGQGFNRGMRI